MCGFIYPVDRSWEMEETGSVYLFRIHKSPIIVERWASMGNLINKQGHLRHRRHRRRKLPIGSVDPQRRRTSRAPPVITLLRQAHELPRKQRLAPRIAADLPKPEFRFPLSPPPLPSPPGGSFPPRATYSPSSSSSSSVQCHARSLSKRLSSTFSRAKTSLHTALILLPTDACAGGDGAGAAASVRRTAGAVVRVAMVPGRAVMLVLAWRWVPTSGDEEAVDVVEEKDEEEEEEEEEECEPAGVPMGQDLDARWWWRVGGENVGVS